MANPVLRGSGYILVHTPDMIIHNGTTQTTERLTNPDSDYLRELPGHIRSFEKTVSYPPNQAYIGNITPDDLKALGQPWQDKETNGANRFGKLGEIMPQDEFIALIKLADSFDLVMLEKGFTASVKVKLETHPIFAADAAKLKEGEELSTIEDAVANHHSEGLYHDGRLVGCVKRAHDIDTNLNAHIMFENLVVKASGALALRNLAVKNGIDLSEIEYIIECSEEACGDMNQRGGGNFAKAIAELAGAVNATGSDTRGFCAAPAHSLIEAASLVKAGTYKSVALVAGGATAKLGMNGKDHVKKGLPILEDVLGGFAVLITEDDGFSPIINTDLVGRHTVGTGSAPQAVISSLVVAPLEKGGLKISDVDKYSVEMQNPDITKPAGAGDVPESNYKMIAALAAMRKEIERSDVPAFIEKHGMPGWAPTQGHIPSGVPYLGFARQDLTDGNINRVMIVGKGSLFLGRMTNLFDGVSVVIERNTGKKTDQTASSTETISRKKIGLTTFGSEHGAENLLRGAELAAKAAKDFDIVLIGPKLNTRLEQIEAADDRDAHKKMEELLDSGYLHGAVTMHYSFPIGVSTVGRVTTPGLGNDMLIATTTGTSSTNRVEGMVKNAIYGIITAKALGIPEPTVGILNLDGARQVEIALKELSENGYKVNFSESVRADGGAVMRGNDLLCGSVDIMVNDSLTGNILMKMFSAFTTGGNYEASGYGYGPGIGEGYKRLILILSRSSGVPVVANAIKYAAELANGKLMEIAGNEFKKAKAARLDEILAKITKTIKKPVEEAPSVEKEVVTEEIPGIDIMSLEDAVAALQSAGLYAESGMGCTGPVVLVNEKKHHKALEILKNSGFLS